MENLESQLRKITDKIENEINGKVSLGELFDLGFLAKNADFETINELFKFHDISASDVEDFEYLNIEVLDKAVEVSTCFGSWNEMLQQAEEEHLVKKLKDAGFDISE